MREDLDQQQEAAEELLRGQLEGRPSPAPRADIRERILSRAAQEPVRVVQPRVWLRASSAIAATGIAAALLWAVITPVGLDDSPDPQVDVPQQVNFEKLEETGQDLANLRFRLNRIRHDIIDDQSRRPRPTRRLLNRAQELRETLELPKDITGDKGS